MWKHLSNEFIKVGLFHTFSIQTRILVEEAIIKYFLNSRASIFFLPCAVLHGLYSLELSHSFLVYNFNSVRGSPYNTDFGPNILRFDSKETIYLFIFLLMKSSENKLYFFYMHFT